MTSTSDMTTPPAASSPTNRRQWLSSTFTKGTTLLGGATLLITSNPLPSNAATTPTPTDLTKLQLGHSRVRYLLANWDDITSVCGKGVMTDMERKQVVRTEGGGGGFWYREETWYSGGAGEWGEG